MLDPRAAADVGLGVAGDVAGRPDAVVVHAQLAVDVEAAVVVHDRVLDEAGGRRHADAHDDEVGLEPAAVVELELAHAGRRRRGGRPCGPARNARRAPRDAAADRPPISGPSWTASGVSSGATTVTSRPRSRRLAAHSMPMKLAPTTTARAAPSSPAMMASQSLHERSVKTPGRSAPGRREARGSAAGRDQHGVGREAAAVAELEAPRGGVEPRHLGVAQLDGVPFVEALRAQRQPVGGRRPGQVVLAQVGAVVGTPVLAAHEDDAAGEAVLAQSLDGGGAGGAAAHHGEHALVGGVAAGHGHGALPGRVVGPVDQISPLSSTRTGSATRPASGGGSSRSPVPRRRCRRCQGHTRRPSCSSPLASGPS